jgi:hypothetical protein
MKQAGARLALCQAWPGACIGRGFLAGEKIQRLEVRWGRISNRWKARGYLEADQVPLPPPPATMLKLPLIEVRSSLTEPLHSEVGPAGTVTVMETLLPEMVPETEPSKAPVLY